MIEDDNPIGDYTASLSLPFIFYLPYRDWVIISFDISPGYDFFLNEDQQRGFNFRYSPGFRFLLLNRFVLSGNYQYEKQRQRVTAEFDERIYVESKGYNASFFYETVRGTALGFSGLINRMGHEDVGGDIDYPRAFDREERSLDFEFYYGILRESDLFMTFGYTDYIFDDPESQWRNSYSFDITPGIRFQFLERSIGTFSLGYRWLINRSDENNRFSGIIGNTNLEFRLGGFNIRFQYVRDFQFSYYRTNIYFVENRFGSGISFYLTPIIRLDYDFSYASVKYPEGQIIPLPDGGFEEIKRKDTYLSHSAGLVFRIVRNTGIGLIVTFWERDSNIEGIGMARTFIGGYLTYDF